MKQATFLEPVPSASQTNAERMAPASLAQWERILPTLAERELEVLYQLCRYVTFSGFDDATGGELAEWMQMPATWVRPRLTGLHKERGMAERGPMRQSRAKLESDSHSYKPCVPIAAVTRARQEQR